MLLEEKKKISEVLQFLILPYTQNRKLGNLGKCSFFFYRGFLSRPFTNHRNARERGGHFLTLRYNFDPLHRHLYISWAITAEGSPLHIDSNRESLVSKRKSLTAKLRALFFYLLPDSCCNL